VAENVLVGQEPYRRVAGVPLLDRRRLREEARRHLESLGFPLDAGRRVKELTTGEKQLVEIAKALHRKARVLVLDEPTAALSRGEALRLFAIMRSLQQRGLGLIYISHHLDEVFHIADRVTVLRDGRNVATWRSAEVSEAELVRAMLGRPMPPVTREEGTHGEPVLELEALAGTGFRDVSLSVRRGEILALTGAAGAGQTELLWALYGAAPVRAGSLRLRGEPRHWSSLREARAAGVLLAPGDRKAYGLVLGLDVGTNFTFPELHRWTRAGMVNWRAVRAAAAERIARYQVRCSGPQQEVQSLSGGNQQKIVVGRVAEVGADVYLFDEPTRGVDIGAREELYALIRRLADGGAAVLVATPDLQEALRLGHTIGVMRAGRLVDYCPAAETSETEMLAALLGAENAGSWASGSTPAL
jgi:ribose transport system ATP-binding protein